MKKFKLFLIIIAIPLIPFSSYLSFAQSAAENLLENGGFEEKGERGLPRGWNVVPHHVGRGEANMDDKIVHSGKYSLRLSPNKKNTPEGFGVYIILDRSIVRGKEVTISGFGRLEGMMENDKNVATLVFKTDKANWLVVPKTVENTFIPFSKTFSVADSIPEAAILLLVGGTKGKVWFDDLSITVSQGLPAKSGPATKSITLKPSEGEYVNKINTNGWQDSAFISPDGQELFFSYLRYAQNDFMDIYQGKISERDVKIKGPIRPGSHGTMNFETYKAVRNKDGTWGKPINLNINSPYHLYSAKLSFDGNELYYALRDYPKNYGEDDIYVSKKLPDGNWGPPENLGPNINTKYREDTPCLSSDGKTLYFGRNTIGETYGWEIMVSNRVDGKWKKAERVALPVNESNLKTTANYQPFVTADGKDLYFTRIQQLYRSERRPDGTWGKPTEVFPSLPVSGHASVTADGRYLYFLTVKDKESLKRQHFTIWYAERQKKGTWGEPKPVD